MMIGRRRFMPAWWSIALTVMAVLLFSALGWWQLERAAYKEAIELKFEQRLVEPYQLLSSADDLTDVEYRKLLLKGRYDNTRNLLVDNQLHRGRAGYYVLTPLLLADSDFVILVNRGWAPWGESRDDLAAIPEPVNVEGVAGIAYFPSEPALRLGDPGSDGRWPRLIPYIEIETQQALFSGQLLPIVLWLAPEQEGHYVRDWNPVWMRPEKSRAYATQWFAFALLSLVFFVILNLRKIE
jgi:surfeit locus 1 family protein